MTKLYIGVLMGGRSVENEVSFNSGRTICDHLDRELFDVVPLFQTKSGDLYILPYKFLHRGKIADFEDRLATEAEKIAWDDLKQRVNFVYIALHGRYGEDGTIQGLLEILGIPYLGSKVAASALARDKILAYTWLTMHGIRVPKHVVVHPTELNQVGESMAALYERLQEKEIQFPCIVKPHKEGSSIGIHVVNKQDDLYNAVHNAATCNQEMVQAVIIEEKLTGKEFSCIIITDPVTQELIALPPTEIELEANTSFFDYEQKYMPGRAIKHTPARFASTVIEEIQEMSKNIMRLLGAQTIIRIDGFYTDNGDIVILDPNTISGMAPSSFLFRQAAELNISHTDLINMLIAAELTRLGIVYKPEKEKKAMEHKKIRVGVLFGGRSNEKEISLESGRNVVYKLSPEKYDIIPLFLNKDLNLYTIDQRMLVHNATAEIEEELLPSMHIPWSSLANTIDFAFLALHGGEGENGTLQGALEMLGIPYNGSGIFTSGLCMDKFKTTQFLKAHGLSVPEGYLITKDQWHIQQEACLQSITAPFPLIVKPHDDGCSVLVHKVHTDKELQAAIETILAHKQAALVEECVQGMELTVGVIGNQNPRALPPSQAVATQGVLSIQEKFLPGAGENRTPAPLSPAIIERVQQTMETAFSVLGCKGYARIDCFYDDKQDRIVIIEVNTLPGLTPATCLFHQAAELGISPMGLLDMIISYGFEEHAKNVPLPEGRHKTIAL